MPLLILSALSVDHPLDRFDRFARAVESLSVDMELRDSRVPEIGTAKVRIQQPNKTHFAVKWGGSDYSFTMVDKKGLEFDRTQGTYFEYDSKGNYYPSTGFYPVPQQLFPIMFATRNIREAIPGLKPIGKKTVDGQTGDAFAAVVESEAGPIELMVVVGEDGRLLMNSRNGGGFDRSIHYKNYRLNEKLANSEFPMTIPTGLTPRSTSSLSNVQPLGPGGQAKGEWISADSRQALALDKILAGKTTLVAFLGEDAPSGESIEALKELKGVPVVILTQGQSDNGLASHGFKTYYDPSGKSAEALRAEGTPYFFLMAPDARVIGSWFGYMPEEKKRFLADIRAALAGNAED